MRKGRTDAAAGAVERDPYREIIGYLERGWTVVTAHDRLARHLRRRFAEVQALKNPGDGSAWPSPRVMTESTFLRASYENAALAAPWDQPFPLLLSDRQANWLWGEVIRQDRLEQVRTGDLPPEELLGARGAADLARNARLTLKRLMQTPWEPGMHYSSDPAAFRRYLTRYEKRLANCNWIELADVPELLIKLLADPAFPPDGLPPRDQILFSGFTEDWPQTRALCEALGGRFHDEPGSPSKIKASGSVVGWSVVDIPSETDAACTWAADQIREWINDPEHGPIPPRIGIAVLNPSTRMDRFERVLIHMMDAEGLALRDSSTDYDPRRLAFTVQNPRPLGSYALVRMALLVLSLDRERIRSADLSELLLSPFLRIAGRQKFQIRNEEPRLRENWPNSMTWTRAVEELSARRITHAQGILKEILSMNGLQDHARPLAVWAADWAAVLSKAGWPRGSGEGMDTATFQVVEKFQSMLAELGSLDLVTGGLTHRDQALNHLDAIMRSTPFQLEGSSGPIEVFDAAECAGLEFDALFLCGFVDEAWPPVPGANHFLPIEELLSAQRGGRAKVDCPGVTADGARRHAEILTSHLLCAASTVVVGLPGSDGQSGRVLRPSHLLPEAAIGSSISPLESGTYGWALGTRIVSESLADQITASGEVSLPIDADEAPRVTGGAYLLRSVSACPVQAFLKYRLGLRSVEDAPLGLEAKEMGTAVHKMVEVFWKQLPVAQGNPAGTPATYDMLATWIEESEGSGAGRPEIAFAQELQDLMDHCVGEAMGNRQVKGILDAMPESYRAEVATTLERILDDWIRREYTTPFTSIEGLEVSAGLEEAGISLSLMVDRIHKETSGQYGLVDYKGSRKSPVPSWMGIRPHEPQLPLYALIETRNNRPVGRLAFGVYGENSGWIQIGTDRVFTKPPSRAEFAAELIGTGVLCPGDWARRLVSSTHTMNQAEMFERLVEGFEQVIPDLVKTYHSGSPILDPLSLPTGSVKPGLDGLVCVHCEFQDVCRIREYLGAEAEVEGGDEDTDLEDEPGGDG